MSDSEHRICKNCKHFDKFDHSVSTEPNPKSRPIFVERHGECHLRPPEHYPPRFPSVNITDFCGEFDDSLHSYIYELNCNINPPKEEPKKTYECPNCAYHILIGDRDYMKTTQCPDCHKIYEFLSWTKVS